MEANTLLSDLKEYVKSILAPVQPEVVEEVILAEEQEQAADPIAEAVARMEGRIADLEARIAALEPSEEEEVAPEEEMTAVVVEEELAEVAMIKHTDVQVERKKAVAFDPRMTVQDRIKMNLGILKN